MDPPRTRASVTSQTSLDEMHVEEQEPPSASGTPATDTPSTKVTYYHISFTGDPTVQVGDGGTICSSPQKESEPCCTDEPPIVNSPTHSSRCLAFSPPQFIPSTRRDLTLSMKAQLTSSLTDKADCMYTGIIGLTSAAGCGKSAMVKQFISDYKDEFSCHLWVDASTMDALVRNYSKLAFDLGLENASTNMYNKNMELVSQWLHQNSRWLLVFDGANDASVLRMLEKYESLEFYPRQPIANGCVIVTSTAPTEALQQHLQISSPIDVPLFSKMETECFLLNSTGKAFEELVDENEKAAFKEIVENIGGLPLKLVQCAAFIKRRRYSFRDYINVYNKKKEWPLFCIPLGIEEKYKEAFDKVELDCAASYFVLCVSAYINECDIPFSLFEYGYCVLKGRADIHPKIYSTLREIFSDEHMSDDESISDEDNFIFKDILHHIVERCLICYQANESSFNINRDIQSLLRKRILKSTNAHTLLEITLQMLLHVCNSRPGDLFTKQHLLQHACVCLTHVKSRFKSLFPLYYRVKLETSYIYATLNMFSEASRIADDISREMGSSDAQIFQESQHLQLQVMIHSAQLHRWSGNIKDAMDVMRKCEQQSLEPTIKNTETEADMCRWMANTLIEDGQLGHVQQYLDRASELYQKIPAVWDAIRYRTKAHLHSLYGRFYKESALKMETKVVDKERNTLFRLSVESYERACEQTDCNDYRHHMYRARLADIKYQWMTSPCVVAKMAAARQADVTLQSAVQEMQKVFGERHRFCAWIRMTRASIMEEIGEQLEESLQLIDTALMTECHIHGSESRHPHIAKAFFIKGNILKKMGRFDEARSILKTCSDHYESHGNYRQIRAVQDVISSIDASS